MKGSSKTILITWVTLVCMLPLFSRGQDNNTPIKCGLPYVIEAFKSEKSELPNLSRLYKLSKTQVQWDSITSPSGHFVIHYNTSEYDSIPSYDRNGNGMPDFLEFAAFSLDRAWEVEIDSLGFQPPPDQNGNPRSTYSIYLADPGRVYNVPPNTYGVTGWDPTQDIPSLPGFNFPSEIWINTDFSFLPDYLYAHFLNGLTGLEKRAVRDSLAIAVTAAHEFNHALQLGYRIWIEQNDFPDLWFIESSATYMEEVVADAINDYYQYLPAFFSNTHRYLTEEASGRIYGGVVFDIMLGERHGKTITREVWEQITQEKALDALSTILQQKGSTLDGELRELATWMFFTDDRYINGNFFPEGDQYPSPAMQQISLSQDETTLSGFLPALSFRFYQINLSSPASISALLTPDQSPEFWDGINFSFQMPYVQTFPANAFTPVQSTSDLRVYLVVFSGSWSADAFEDTFYELLIRKSSQVATEEILVYPNIIRPEDGVDQIVFANLPEDARIEIYTSSGVHLFSLSPEDGQRVAFWKLKNFENNAVGSGVYVYRVISPEKSVNGKILIVR
ncbi:MAG: T9SS C-terminal target domain-containing protein [Calditrichaeota bacterium]|nr:MAG: T9SS C-terminal target domain-containing protein [Calditrichota bacterium]